MKRLGAVIVIIAVVAGLFLLLRSNKPLTQGPSPQSQSASGETNDSSRPQGQEQSGFSPASNAAASAGSVSSELAARTASPGAITPPGETNALPNLPPAVALDKARVILHNYRAAFGENPVGTNPEITEALKGKNSKQTDFLSDSGLHTNEKGELLDGYGTPFFFHQISGKEMEIRSAGADQVLWTADDLVTK